MFLDCYVVFVLLLLRWSHVLLLSKLVFTNILVYFKNAEGNTQEIVLKPEETMNGFVTRVGELGGMEDNWKRNASHFNNSDVWIILNPNCY